MVLSQPALAALSVITDCYLQSDEVPQAIPATGGVAASAICGGRYSLTPIRPRTKITETKIGVYFIRLPTNFPDNLLMRPTLYRDPPPACELPWLSSSVSPLGPSGCDQSAGCAADLRQPRRQRKSKIAPVNTKTTIATEALGASPPTITAAIRATTSAKTVVRATAIIAS